MPEPDSQVPLDRTVDRALAERLRHGSESAQEELHRRMAPRLRATATYFLGWADQDIDDVVQQTFLTAFEKMDQYDPARAGLYTWMNHLCVFLCFKRVRARKRLVLTLAEDLHSIPAVRPDPADAEQAERLEALRVQMEKLEEPCRSLVRDRVQQGRSYAALAEALAVPMGTVASRLARCLQTLRTRMLAED
jgi:RNA polymerase sigma-70 factor (ECF subfamily)